MPVVQVMAYKFDIIRHAFPRGQMPSGRYFVAGGYLSSGRKHSVKQGMLQPL